MTKSEQNFGRVLGAATMRAEHSRLMLNLLWKEQEISRADLSRRTGLSRSTVSAIVADLLETGLVREARAGRSTGGRRPIILAFNNDANLTIGIELGATHVSCVLTDLQAQVLAWRTTPVPVRDQPKEALSVVEASIKAVLEQAKVPLDRVLGIGVAVPSPVDRARPGRLLASVVPKWADYDLIETLGAAFGRPVFVENDANLGALAELWWGVGREAGDLAYIKVATGIGAGLIVEGRIFRGSGGMAGEIGHTAIDTNGPLCNCGLRGCLTTFIGTQALLARAREEWTGRGEPKNVDALVDAALAGEATAKRVIDYAGGQLGIGVSNMLNLLNPKTVIIGGGLSRAGDLLLDPLRKTVQQMSLADSIAQANIRGTTLDEQGISVGAATLVLESALEAPEMFLRVAA